MTWSMTSLLHRFASTRALVSLAAAVTVATTATVLLATGWNQSPSTPSDTAFLDAQKTSDLIERTSAIVDQVFTVDPSHRGATGKSMREHLTADAQAQFRELYAPYLAKSAEEVALLTSTLGIGVVHQSGSTAEVLVIATQQASARDGRSNSGTAELRLHLIGQGSDWQIASIEVV